MLECSNIIEQSIWKKMGKKIPMRNQDGTVEIFFPGKLNGAQMVKLLEMTNFIVRV